MNIGPISISFRRKTAPISVPRYRRGKNLMLWQTSKASVDQARELFATEFFQELLSVLHAHIPHGFASGDGAGQQLGRMNGYMEALRVLEATCDYAPMKTEEPESTFGINEAEFNQPQTT